MPITTTPSNRRLLNIDYILNLLQNDTVDKDIVQGGNLIVRNDLTQNQEDSEISIINTNNKDAQLILSGLKGKIENTTGHLTISNVEGGGSHIKFMTSNSTERMSILGSGRVLIGTTTDNGSDLLQVNGNINISNSNSLRFGSGFQYITNDAPNNKLIFSSNGEQNVTIANGRVGISTTNPAYGLKLDVNGRGRYIINDSSNVALQLENTQTQVTNILYRTLAGGNDWYAGNDNGHFTWWNGDYAMRITQSRRLLIATTIDDGVNTLQVNGSSQFSGDLSVYSNSSRLYLKSTSSPTGYYSYLENRYDGANQFNLSVGSTKILGVMTLNSVGRTYINGYYGINFCTGAETPIDASVQMVLNSTGYLSVGNVNPTERLTINGRISLLGSGYTTNPTNILLGQYANGIGYIHIPTSGQFDFWDVGTTTIMRIKENGNVIIGNNGIDDGVNRFQVNGTGIIDNIRIQRGGIVDGTFVGVNAGGTANAHGNHTVGIGDNVLVNNTGAYNTAVGSLSMFNNTTGSYNTAYGRGALQFNTIGDHSTAVGYATMFYNTKESYSVAIGSQALQFNGINQNAVYSGMNIAIGYISLRGFVGTGYESNLNQFNVAIGSYAMLYAKNATYNVAIGHDSSVNISTGTQNTAIGSNSMYLNTNGSYNTALGMYALRGMNGFSYNTAIGYQSQLDIQGNHNITLGAYSGSGITSVSNYNVLIGSYNGARINGQDSWMIFSTGDGTERFSVSPGGRMLLGSTTDNGSDLLQVTGSLLANELKLGVGNTVTTETITDGNRTIRIKVNGTYYKIMAIIDPVQS